MTQVIAFEGDGQLTEFGGGYDDWRRFQTARSAEAAAAKSRPAPAAPKAPQKAGKSRLSFKESRELEALPERIEALEQEQKAIAERLTDAALYRDQPQEVKRLQERLAIIEEETGSMLVRWEELESKQK